MIDLDNFKSTFLYRYGEEIWAYLALFYLAFIIGWTYFINKKFSERNVVFADLAWFFLLATGCLVMQWPNLLTQYLHVDESQHIGEARILARDPRFWFAVDATTVGPLTIYLPSFISYLGAEINYFSIRMLNILLWLMISLFTYKTSVLYMHRHRARYLTLSLFVTFPLFFHKDYVSYNGEIVAATFLSIAFYLFLKSRLLKENNFITLLLCGTMLTLAPFAKLQVGPVALVFGVMLVYSNRKYRKRIVAILSGVFIPLISLTVFLFYYQLWADFFTTYIINNFYYTSGGIELPHKLNLFMRLLRFPFLLFERTETIILFLFAIVGLVYATYLIWKKRVAINDHQLLTYSLIYFALSCLVVVLPGNKYYHYAILIIPPAVFVCACAFNMLPINQIHIFIICLVCTQGVINAFGFREVFTRLKNYDDTWKKNERVVSYLKHHSQSGMKLAQWGYDTFIYSETDLLMGTRDAQTHRHILTKKQQTYYVNRYIRDLKRNQPELFIDNTKNNSYIFDYDTHNFRNYPALKSYIERYYVMLKEIEGVEVFKRKIESSSSQLQ